MTTLFIQNDKVFTQMMIFSLKLLFWAKKVVIWWLFNNNLSARQQEREKKKQKFRAKAIIRLLKSMNKIIARYTRILKKNSTQLWEKSIVLWKLSPTTEIGNFILITTTHKHTKAQGCLGGQGGCKIITPFELQLTRTTCTLWQSRSPRDTRFVI